ncbi:hypothetical protein YC2023_045702 [Brassica napus]
MINKRRHLRNHPSLLLNRHQLASPPVPLPPASSLPTFLPSLANPPPQIKRFQSDQNLRSICFIMPSLLGFNHLQAFDLHARI